MLGLTPLLSHGPFIDKALQACDKLLDPENIETFMRLLYKGIVSGLDLRGEYPVKGDISMYGDEMSKYSIGSGFAGVSLALLNLHVWKTRNGFMLLRGRNIYRYYVIERRYVVPRGIV